MSYPIDCSAFTRAVAHLSESVGMLTNSLNRSSWAIRCFQPDQLDKSAATTALVGIAAVCVVYGMAKATNSWNQPKIDEKPQVDLGKLKQTKTWGYAVGVSLIEPEPRLAGCWSFEQLATTHDEIYNRPRTRSPHAIE